MRKVQVCNERALDIASGNLRKDRKTYRIAQTGRKTPLRRLGATLVQDQDATAEVLKRIVFPEVLVASVAADVEANVDRPFGPTRTVRLRLPPLPAGNAAAGVGRVDFHADLNYLEGIHTKSGKRRSVPLNTLARQAIEARKAFRAEHCPASPWVSCDGDGNRGQSTKRSRASACRRAGIRDFRIHHFCHTCAAWLVSAGVPLTEVRDLLGHSTIRMTERHARLAPENVRAAVARLEVRTEGNATQTGVASHDLVTFD